MLMRRLILLALVLGFISGCSSNRLKRASDPDYGYLYTKSSISFKNGVSKDIDDDLVEKESYSYTDLDNFSIGYRFNRFDDIDFSYKRVRPDEKRMDFLSFRTCYPFKISEKSTIVPKLSFLDFDESEKKDLGFIMIGLDFRYEKNKDLTLKCGIHENSIIFGNISCYFVGINYDINPRLNLDMDLSYLISESSLLSNDEYVRTNSAMLLEYDLGYNLNKKVMLRGFGSVLFFDDEEEDLMLYFGGSCSYDFNNSVTANLTYSHDFYYENDDAYDTRGNYNLFRLGLEWKFY